MARLCVRELPMVRNLFIALASLGIGGFALATGAGAVQTALTPQQVQQCAAGTADESAMPLPLQRACDQAREQGKTAISEAANSAGDSAKAAGKQQLNKQWQSAVDDATEFHIRDHISNRTFALVAGLIWLYFNWRRTAFRKRLRRR